jgi:hypothetical protein
MSEWNHPQQQQQQQQRQPAISFATPPNAHRADNARGPFADPHPSQGSHPYLGVQNSEYPQSSSTLNVHEHELADHGSQYEEEAQPLTQSTPGGFGGGFYPPSG